LERYHERVIRPVWAEIDLAALRYNLTEIRRVIGPAVDIMAVVKAEGYGHGATEIAKAACEWGAGWLGVALPEEGIALRRAGITAPILVFAVLQADQADVFWKYDLTPTICLIEPAVALSREAVKAGKTVSVHLKVDTGMGRVGVPYYEAAKVLKTLKLIPGIKVEGVYSHFATADHADKEYARTQIQRFEEMVGTLKSQGLLPERLHLANSAATIELPQAYYSMVRPGIILYGLYPSAEVDRSKLSLKPVLSLKTKVIYWKRVKAGTGISYGQKYHTPRDTTIVTLPVGYADGWSRMLSHKAEALIGGKRYPVVGTICMDQCMVDVGDDPVEIGSEVVLIGSQGKECITADEIAARLGTINYEVTCMISDRVPRVYINRDTPETD
jgi:alanine racemase